MHRSLLSLTLFLWLSLIGWLGMARAQEDPPAENPANELVARLGLPGMEDKELGDVARAILNERLEVKAQNELTNAEWMAYEQALRRELEQTPTALGLYLLAGLNIKLATGKDDPRAEEALNLALRCLAAAPNSSRAECTLGQAYFGLQRLVEAVAELEAAIRLDPKGESALNNLCMAYLILRRNDDAVAACKDVIRKVPQSAFAHTQLGDVYMTQVNSWDSAVTEYKEAIRLAPQDAYPHSCIAGIYHLLKQYDAAVAELEQAIQLDPQNAGYHNVLGMEYVYTQRYNEAAEELKRSIRLDPTTASSHYYLGIAYSMQQHYDLSITEIKEAISLDPQNASMHLLLAEIYFEALKDYVSAKEHFLLTKELSQPGEEAYDAAAAYLAKPELQ